MPAPSTIDGSPSCKRSSTSSPSGCNTKRRKIELTQQLADTHFETVQRLFDGYKAELERAKEATQLAESTMSRAYQSLEIAKKAAYAAEEDHCRAMADHLKASNHEARAADQFRKVTIARDVRSALGNKEHWSKEVEDHQMKLKEAKVEKKSWTEVANTSANSLEAGDLETLLQAME
ncbi:hypothetical protein FLONG3_3568 [Fusarium longipes]|uniref:Uncharacterized protein n=1 Tax=Fusarium longipes TaxID=694270 RepID=A0A395T0I5_9HYPO|nr:hypothetical protein FLONG3_3568 [Fusarium longipes]